MPGTTGPRPAKIPQVAGGAGVYSAPIESEQRLLSPYLVLTQFLYPNEFPLRWGTLYCRKGFGMLRSRSRAALRSAAARTRSPFAL
jgi:hypothetical protein